VQNIIDYLNWRGDLSFARDGFNEVDNLIMSSLAYLDFDSNLSSTLNSAKSSLYESGELNKEKINSFAKINHNPFFKKIPSLLYKAVQSPRYRDIKLSNYVNMIDYEQSVQFSAITFSINRDLHFVAFRGTDDSIIGWKEDLQMSFLGEVPAQKQAVIYLNRVCSQLEGSFYIGGHSKGGNLAVYAAAKADKEVSDKILAVFNNDGPGFQTDVIKSEGYQRIVPKICTFLPKSSTIGILLEHSEKYNIVSSGEIGIMQHNAFSWEVRGTHFVYEQDIAKSSLMLQKTVRDWLEHLPLEQREQFICALFDIIQATGAKTFGDMSKEKLAKSISMIKNFNNMDNHTRLILIKTISLFFNESRKNINKAIITDLDSLLAKRK